MHVRWITKDTGKVCCWTSSAIDKDIQTQANPIIYVLTPVYFFLLHFHFFCDLNSLLSLHTLAPSSPLIISPFCLLFSSSLDPTSVEPRLPLSLSLYLLHSFFSLPLLSQPLSLLPPPLFTLPSHSPFLTHVSPPVNTISPPSFSLHFTFTLSLPHVSHVSPPVNTTNLGAHIYLSWVSPTSPISHFLFNIFLYPSYQNRSSRCYD